MKVAMVGPQALARGFGLVGVETFVAKSAKEAHEFVSKICTRKDIGVVLITQEFYYPFYEKYFQMKISMERPILLEIPSVEEIDFGTQDISHFVKRATGVTV